MAFGGSAVFGTPLDRESPCAIGIGAGQRLGLVGGDWVYEKAELSMDNHYYCTLNRPKDDPFVLVMALDYDASSTSGRGDVTWRLARVETASGRVLTQVGG